VGSIDPLVLRVLSDLGKGLLASHVEFCVIGALVPEVLLGVPPRRRTNDADATVVVETLDQFDQLKADLAAFGFTPTRHAYRLAHSAGGWVDLLPYSRTLVPSGQLELNGGLSFNMAGFEHVMPSRLEVSVAEGLVLPIAPVPLYVLLKLVAYADRRAAKDLGGILHCLQHYAEDDERRYGLEHDGAHVPFEYTCAYLVGIDGSRFCDSMAVPVSGVLDRFESPDAPIVGLVAGEDGRAPLEDRDRIEIFDLFQWYRRATSV
jgi:predicted nucleotidyltransferase